MTQLPLYTSRGQWAGMLVDGHLYNIRGEWMGWVERDGSVYSVSGVYVGALSKDMRVLSKRAWHELVRPRRTPPTRPPEKITLPSHVPLPPLMAELSHDTVDVLEESPERLHTLDADPDAKDLD